MSLMESTSLFLGKRTTVRPGLEGKGEPLVVRIITTVLWPGRYPLQGIKKYAGVPHCYPDSVKEGDDVQTNSLSVDLSHADSKGRSFTVRCRCHIRRFVG